MLRASRGDSAGANATTNKRGDILTIPGVRMSVNVPHLCDLLSTALDPTRLTAAALVSTTGAIVVSASRSTKSKDRTAIIMASLATAMWEDAATPGEKKDEVHANFT